MNLRRWTSDREIGDPRESSRRQRQMRRIPDLGEAGPSNWQGSHASLAACRLDDEVREEDGVVGGPLDQGIIPKPYHASAFSSPLSLALPLLLLPFLPIVNAVPPRQRRPPPPPPPNVTPPPLKRRIVPYLDLDSYPDVDTTPSLPTQTTILPETAMPYVLSKQSDGSWTKIDNGWSVFGRQAGPTDPVLADADPSATATGQPLSWAIEQSLPTGWGQTSNRTYIYQVSLISVAAVIMAFGIVAGIMIIVINRRKAHRRAKRRAERHRRKQLAAEGLTEDDINGTAANAAFALKLEELEKQHRSPKVKKAGPASLVRVKVRNWHSGLRRRKGRKVEEDIEIEVIEEDGKPVESVDSDHTHDMTDEDSSRHGSTTDERPSTAEGSDHSPTTTQDSNNSTNRSSDDAAQPHTYFPPAYRPASVRSLQVEASSSSSSAPPPHPAEKTVAPGYYPAPVNEESEEAIAIASRSDGKAPLRESEREEREREHNRHIATDDKRELERMRLAASAPMPSMDEVGPSAPSVDVDEQGFEREAFELSPTQPTPAGFGGGSLPAPPARLRSYRGHFEVEREGVERGVDETMDELNLIPSAPPTSVVDSQSSMPSQPSAPPMMDDVDEPDAQVLPSAPFVIEDEDEDDDRPSRRASIEGSIQSRAASQHSECPSAPQEDSRTSTPGPVFLPKYEP